MKSYLLFFFSLIAFSVAAQSDFAGVWVGTITQNEGGYRSEYYFEFHINEIDDDGLVYGKTFVKVDTIFAKMEFTGKIQSGVYLQFQESEILTDKKFVGMDWCLKRGQLIIRKDENEEFILEGYWQGKTSFSECIPGKILLRRGVPRA
ncbi:MAG: hypothetical protein KDC34_05345 [Saprospiraceae bacterium]|nr:hypothetical protein [Saprospiraceae bacterium]